MGSLCDDTGVNRLIWEPATSELIGRIYFLTGDCCCLQIDWVEQQHEYVREKRGLHHQQIVTRGIEPRFADPLWEEQWYLVSC